MTDYTQCGARNCARRPRPRSRYCRLHYERIKLAGGINGRILYKHQLRPYQEIARGWVDRNRAHPAVSAAIEWMAEQLAPTDSARFLRAEWERLRAASVEPEDMLAAVLAVRLFDVYSAQPFDESGPLDVNTGRAVLRCAPARVTSVAKSGRKDSRRVRASHARALGEYVRETLGALPILAAQSMEAGLSAAAGPSAAIREGLLIPFGSTTEGQEDEDG